MDVDEKADVPKHRGGPIYECVKCGRRVDYKELERYISFRCPFCGYRIFRKVRAPIVKRLKAR
ncbi:MAG: DNA-directed RNA polymerase subunit P [Candidatus Bathyarchaeota archaeon]|nr:MAG: DNA-directed RNA polymerase subunit P [Candidatus Bathyarchaeota archaeon]